MRPLTRREFIATATAMGATLAWSRSHAASSKHSWTEAPEVFAEGVASGDPAPDSVLLWARVSNSGSSVVPLAVEVAEDSKFERVVATAQARALAEADHTCRVLVGGLRPSHIYWYHFI